MACCRVEKQRVARLHDVASVGMAVSDFASEHVDEFDAGVAEIGIGHRIALQGDEIGLDNNRAAE